MWPTLIFSGTAALFLYSALASLWHLRWVRRLPTLDDLPGEAMPVRCSVVIAARNEAARIGETIQRLLAQRGIDLQIIVVDDRSTDGTSEILLRLAVADARLQVQRVDSLPAGWLGKCHACHLGARAASGDWILFTDGDCWHRSDLVLRAVRLAEREAVDHVTLTPGAVVESPAARGWYLLFLTSLLSWIASVNRDRGRYIGVGAFNLVRADAYRACGGYEALRLTVLDDMKLGLLLRRAGRRSRGFLGSGDVECRWATTVGSAIKLMEKNYFAALDYRLDLALAASAFFVLVSIVLAVGLLSGTAAGLAAALSPLALIAPAGILSHRLGWSWSCAVCVPFMYPVFFYALLNSAFVTLRQGGIRWRDTFYSLESLRAGNAR